ncbi:LruC domain-containing protein [Vibrio chagasii]|nr:LruC domain-containing protein [Vibrio chagasii]
MTFSISLPFNDDDQPTVSSLLPLSGFDPFIFGPGEGITMALVLLALRVKDLEIHTADLPPTSRGTLVSDFYGVAQDDSDPSSGKYYRTTQNMP